MTLNLVKIVDKVVAAARLYAANRRLAEFRYIAGELRRAADEYDGRADEIAVAALRERVDA